MVYTCVGFIIALAVVRVVGGRRWLCGGPSEVMGLFCYRGRPRGRQRLSYAARPGVRSTVACLRRCACVSTRRCVSFLSSTANKLASGCKTLASSQRLRALTAVFYFSVQMCKGPSNRGRVAVGLGMSFFIARHAPSAASHRHRQRARGCTGVN